MSYRFALYNFEPENIDHIVAQGFDAIGVSQRISGSSLIMLKPNLVSDIEEYIAQGCNTDTRLIEAVLKYLAQYNARVVIAESETGTKVKGRKLQEALELMGVTSLQSRYKFDIVNLTYDTQVNVDFPKGLLLSKLNMGKTSLDADLIIDMPKLKTHKYATITCALKNMFGLVPDPLRVMYHKNIHKAVADISSLFIDKTIVVLDGIKCMEGQGPIFGNAIDMNVVGFCDNMLANDICAARIMGLEPMQVPHIRLFADRYQPIDHGQIMELGTVGIENIRRPFIRARKNWFIRIEEQMMRSRTIVRIISSDFVRRHITWHFRGILKKLRGGSYRWHIEENKRTQK